MQKNGGRLYMKDKIEFDELRKNKTKPTENQKSKGRNLNVESDEQPLLGADQLADDEGAYEDEEHKDELKIGKMPSKSRNGESSRSKGRSGTSKQQKMPEYSPESSPIHHPMQRPRGQHDEYGYGAAGPYDQQNLAGYGTPQKQTEMMGANRGFMGGQGATMPAGYRGASPAGQGNYVPVPIPIVVENGGESSNEEQDDRDAEHQNSDSDEAAHNGNDSNSDDENQDNSGETENFGKNPTSPAQSEGEHDGQTPDGEANHSSGETEAKSQSEEKKSEDESDQGSNEESEAGSGQTKKSDEIPNFLGEYESN
ncbi:hypothetical protein niasHS_002967 [Heterodera schachtii]|uniref:Uncharacterized protein n=1 Tax=Heterodera schachtii TaxID=97005 RepID=A0ABD2K9D2_HETSC